MSLAPRFAATPARINNGGLNGAPPIGPACRHAAWMATMLLAALLLPLGAGVAQAASLVFLWQALNGAMVRTGSPLPAASSPVTIGRTVYFAAKDAAHGVELWKSDGTRGGTQLVSDINPGPGHSNPSDLTRFQGMLFFAANDGTHGAELWKSDGTPAGTALVADLNPAAGDAKIGNLTVAGDSLFFTADDGAHGSELWVYTGTTPSLVKDINGGAGGSRPHALTAIDGKLLFSADDGAHGFQLWTSDGTPVNTSMIPVVNPFGTGDLTGLAPAGTRRHVSISGGGHGAFLRPNRGATASRIKNVKPSDGSNRLWLTAAGNTRFFRSDSGTRGRVLWRRDGNFSSAPQVEPPSPNSDSAPFWLSSLNHKLYFAAISERAGRLDPAYAKSRLPRPAIAFWHAASS